MESYLVLWDAKEVGKLIDPIPDMWYLEGHWESNATDDSLTFEKLLRSIDAREAMTDLTKGTELILRNNEKLDLKAIGISLDNDRLFVRRMPEESKEESRNARQGIMYRILKFFKAD